MEKISAILTDNGSNMIAAFKEWVQSLQTRDSEADEEDTSSQSPVASPVGNSDDDGDSDQDLERDFNV